MLDELPDDAVDLGEEHAYTRLVDNEGNWAGILQWHRRDGRWCVGHAMFDDGQPGTTWSVESRDPLTMSPSLLCSCGDHGWIRDGRWQRA